MKANIDYDKRNSLLGINQERQIDAAIQADDLLKEIVLDESAGSFSTSDLIRKIDNVGGSMSAGWNPLRTSVSCPMEDGIELFRFFLFDFSKTQIDPSILDFEPFDPQSTTSLSKVADVARNFISSNPNPSWWTSWKSLPSEIRIAIDNPALDLEQLTNLCRELQCLLGVPTREEKAETALTEDFLYAHFLRVKFHSDMCRPWRPTSLSGGDSWAYCSSNEKFIDDDTFRSAGCAADLRTGEGSLPEILLNISGLDELEFRPTVRYLGSAKDYLARNLIDVVYPQHRSTVLGRLA